MSKVMKPVAQRCDLDRATEIVRANAPHHMLTHYECAKLVEEGIQLGRVLGPDPKSGRFANAMRAFMSRGPSDVP